MEMTSDDEDLDTEEATDEQVAAQLAEFARAAAVATLPQPPSAVKEVPGPQSAHGQQAARTMPHRGADVGRMETAGRPSTGHS